jgi:predicted Zn finger-like uncharacterized protein
MKIICDSCSTKYSIADDKVRGKVFKIKCKKCGHIIVVRGAAGAEAAQPSYNEKETKVFDYDESKQAAAAFGAADAGEAVWHLVIDQEQVGPMTVAEVQERYQRGEIDGETYAWREGFGDWLRLIEVEDFAHLAGGGRGGGAAGGEDAVGGMFGGPPIDDTGGAGRSDPADLFAAASGDTGERDEPGNDLFGGYGGGSAQPMAAHGGVGAQDEGGLFGGGGGGRIEASGLTGQRNENSVLFSLSNLAALASDAPKPVAAPSAAVSPAAYKASPDQPVGGGVTEGSGLIDIRAMASVYLGDQGRQNNGSGGGMSGSAADLPVFAPSSFDGGAHVLMPTASAGSHSKILYILLAFIGVLVLAAVVLGYMLVRAGDDPRRVASATDDDVTGTDPAATPTPAATGGAMAAAGSAPGAGAPGGGATTASAAAATTAGTAGGATPPAAGAGQAGGAAAAAAGTPAADPPVRVASRDRDRDSRRSGSSSRSSGRRERSESSDEGEGPAAAAPRPAATKEKCDEVACLVDPSLPCCSGGGSRSIASKPRGEDRSDLPEQLSHSDVSSGIGAVRGRVTSCGDKHSFKGTVTVKISISADGKVTGAAADKGPGDFQGCVASAIKSAKFKKTQKSLTVKYPFVFR